MDKPITRAKMLKDIADFCKQHAMTPTDFGRQALGDSAFMGRFKDGRSPTLERIERCYDFMCNFGKKKKGAKLHDLCG